MVTTNKEQYINDKTKDRVSYTVLISQNGTDFSSVAGLRQRWPARH